MEGDEIEAHKIVKTRESRKRSGRKKRRANSMDQKVGTY